MRFQWEPIRISVPNVWAGSSTENIHKVTESADFIVEKTKYQDSDIYRRHTDSSYVQRGGKISQGHNNLSSPKPGVCNQPQEICARPNSDIADKQSDHDLCNPKRETREISKTLQRSIETKNDSIKESGQYNREFDGNSPSLYTSSTASQVSSKTQEPTITEKKSELRDVNNPELSSERGVKMVVGQHEIKKWKSDKNPTTRSDNEFRCSRGSPGRLGGSLRESVSGRSMDQGREEGTHRCARIKSCVIGHKNVHKEHKSEIESRCNSSELESKATICFPPFLFDREVSRENKTLSSNSNTNSTNMDIPTMVSNIVRDDHSKPQNYSNKPRHFESPLRGNTPAIREQNPKISSVESFRGKTPSGELSTTASNLIKQSKSLGTRNHYKSAWKSFESRCNKEKVDPISCPLEHILNYLGSLYEKWREYNTINGHKSAISSLHKPIEGIPVGQHPSVTSLMKGISREKPPMPKYINIWDVDKVLEQFKQMPENDGLNLKELSFKTITLLGLTAPKRGSELR